MVLGVCDLRAMIGEKLGENRSKSHQVNSKIRNVCWKFHIMKQGLES